MWIGCFVLIGVVFILIAANIGTSVAVARLTRQLNVDPVTGMATIPGSDDVVMKTSTAVYKGEDVSFHNVPINYLSTVTTVEFNHGDISFDVKGFARMINDTILLVEGGSLIFDIDGLKNITGDELTTMFSSLGEDMETSDPDGRRLCTGVVSCFIDAVSPSSTSTAPAPAPVLNPTCFGCNAYSYEVRIRNGVPNVAEKCCDFQESGAWAGNKCGCSGEPGDKTTCYPLSNSNYGGILGNQANRCGYHPPFSSFSCPQHLPYCNEGFNWCRSETDHRDAQESSKYDYYPHCHSF